MVEYLFIAGKAFTEIPNTTGFLCREASGWQCARCVYIWHITWFTNTSVWKTSANFPSQKMQLTSLEFGLSPTLTSKLLSSLLSTRGGLSLSDKSDDESYRFVGRFLSSLSYPPIHRENSRTPFSEQFCQATCLTDPCMVIWWWGWNLLLCVHE